MRLSIPIGGSIEEIIMNSGFTPVLLEFRLLIYLKMPFFRQNPRDFFMEFHSKQASRLGARTQLPT